MAELKPGESRVVNLPGGYDYFAKYYQTGYDPDLYEFTDISDTGGVHGGGKEHRMLITRKAVEPEPAAPAPAPSSGGGGGGTPSLAPQAPPTPVNAPVTEEEIAEITPPGQGLESTVETGPIPDPLNALDQPGLEEMDAVTGEEIERPSLAPPGVPPGLASLSGEDEEETSGGYLWRSKKKKPLGAVA